jgi:hypothetical protein
MTFEKIATRSCLLALRQERLGKMGFEVPAALFAVPSGPFPDVWAKPPAHSISVVPRMQEFPL